MFSNNQKISIRQIRRLLILDLFGLSSLLLPGLLAESAGPDGVTCIVLAVICAIAYIWVLGKVLNRMEGDYYSCLKKLLGSFVSDLLLIFYLFFFLLLASFVLYQLTSLVRAWLLPGGPYGWICVLVLILAGAATVRGIEGRARIYEILFWFLMIPLIFMMVLASKGVNMNYWTPIFNTSWEGLRMGTIRVFVFFLPVFFILFLKPYCASPRKLCRSARWAVVITAGLNVLIFLVLLGNFQVKTTISLERPVITLMSMVKLPGGFFARLDAFMTAIWFFSLFALMNTGVFYSSHILKELFREKRTHYGLVLALVVVYGLSQWFFQYHNADMVYSWYLKYIALPVLVILPVLLWAALALKQAIGKERKQV
ncbi:MAG: GerAB/ArcD/ProY family transporter [Lachnospiraceae bacterium]|jgi:spore germination protein|nr:GerAB/ArcD/ProY family transporter [Lachnospiraceae bacterium]